MVVWWAAQADLQARGTPHAHSTSVTASPDPLFAVVTTVEGVDTVLALRGRVENGASFERGAILEATINEHPTSIVLDLSELEFIGPAGLVAIDDAERRVKTLGSRLTIRSSSGVLDHLHKVMESPNVRTSTLRSRLLGNIAGTKQPRTVAAGTQRRQLGAEKAAGPEYPLGHDSPPFEEDVRKVVAMPAHPDVVDGALHLLVDLTLARVQGADGVSVSLLRHGLLSTVAASNQTIMDMDTNQYVTGEGPCIDASVQGHWFHAASLVAETRWPAFTPRAMGLGIHSILSSPLRAFAAPIGALNIYSRSDSAFDAEAEATAAVFAQRASVILSDAGAGVSDGHLAARFHEALQSRQSIAIALGIIIEREGVDERSAFGALLRLSLYNGMPLRAQAEALLSAAGPSTFGQDMGIR
jgi:anti-anti-sigma regulatory factor